MKLKKVIGLLGYNKLPEDQSYTSEKQFLEQQIQPGQISMKDMEFSIISFW